MASVKKHASHKSDYDLYSDVEKIKEAIREATLDAKGKATEVLYDSMSDIKNQTTALREGVEDYTASKPFKSLGLALLTGVVAGYLMSRK